MFWTCRSPELLKWAISKGISQDEKSTLSRRIYLGSGIRSGIHLKHQERGRNWGHGLHHPIPHRMDVSACPKAQKRKLSCSKQLHQLSQRKYIRYFRKHHGPGCTRAIPGFWTTGLSRWEEEGLARIGKGFSHLRNSVTDLSRGPEHLGLLSGGQSWWKAWKLKPENSAHHPNGQREMAAGSTGEVRQSACKLLLRS